MLLAVIPAEVSALILLSHPRVSQSLLTVQMHVSFLEIDPFLFTDVTHLVEVKRHFYIDPAYLINNILKAIEVDSDILINRYA